MEPSLTFNYDNELVDSESEEPLTDEELFEWESLIHAEMFQRGLRGGWFCDEKGLVTIQPGTKPVESK